MPGQGRPLRFLVAGAGAVGSGFGAMLRLAGHEVELLGRNRAHMDAVRERGLRLTGIWGERTAAGFRVTDDPAAPGEADYVLVTTKSYDTEAVLDELGGGPAAGGAQFVTLQNGLGNVEAVSARAGGERTIGGMVIIGFALPSPGEVAVTVYGGKVLLGRPGALQLAQDAGTELVEGAGALEGAPPDDGVAALVDAFGSAGIPAGATDNIMGAIWGKVLYNCALNALGAILEVPYGELGAPPTWEIMGDAVREAFAVARAEGVRLPWPDAPSYLEFLRSKQLPATAEHRSSMLQDLERGRRTEIDYLNGAVARLGAERGVATPVNAALSALVCFLERGAGRTESLPPRGGVGFRGHHTYPPQ